MFTKDMASACQGLEMSWHAASPNMIVLPRGAKPGIPCSAAYVIQMKEKKRKEKKKTWYVRVENNNNNCSRGTLGWLYISNDSK